MLASWHHPGLQRRTGLARRLQQGCRLGGEIRDGTTSQIPNALCRYSNWLSVRVLGFLICEVIAQFDAESNFKKLK